MNVKNFSMERKYVKYGQLYCGCLDESTHRLDYSGIGDAWVSGSCKKKIAVIGKFKLSYDGLQSFRRVLSTC